MTLNLLVVALLLLADLAIFPPPVDIQLPAFFAIGFEILVYLSLFFAFSWLFTKHKFRCLISILTLLISIVPLRYTYSGALKRDNPALHSTFDEPNTLKVLSYNTHLLQNNTPVEQNDLLRYIRESGADVVCMQEYAVYKDKHYPTFQRVKDALTDIYPYTYFDFSVHNRRIQYGLAVYSKYPLRNKTTIPIQATGNGANLCDMVVRDDTIRLFNNHLQSNSLQPNEIDSLIYSTDPKKQLSSINYQLSTNLVQRTTQARKVREAIEASPYPVIVCGDFNDVPVSYTYRHISRGLKDAFLTTSFLRTGHTYVKHGLGIRIDYILYSDKFDAIDFHIDRVPYSDHYPISATFIW